MLCVEIEGANEGGKCKGLCDSLSAGAMDISSMLIRPCAGRRAIKDAAAVGKPCRPEVSVARLHAGVYLHRIVDLTVE